MKTLSPKPPGLRDALRGTYRASWDDADVRNYGMNTARDRDRDGRACER